MSVLLALFLTTCFVFCGWHFTPKPSYHGICEVVNISYPRNPAAVVVVVVVVDLAAAAAAVAAVVDLKRNLQSKLFFSLI